LKLEIKQVRKKERIFDSWFVVVCCLLVLLALAVAEYIVR